MAQLVKGPPAVPGDLGSTPGLGRFPGDGKGCPLQDSGLENPMVHGVTESQTRLSVSDFHFTAFEKKLSLNLGNSIQIRRPGLLATPPIYPLAEDRQETQRPRGRPEPGLKWVNHGSGKGA